MQLRYLLASPLGFLIGLSLGALGGGGSILAVPALQYGAGLTFKQAQAGSLVLVLVTAAIGIVPHLRSGHVKVVPGLLFGLAGAWTAILGSKIAKHTDQDVLQLLFSVVMVAAAVALWRRANRQEAAERARIAASTAVPLDGGAAVNVDLPSPRLRLTPALVAKVVVGGAVVGLVTGVFGVGGGFVIVPALVLAFGFAMPDAVGTSLLVITINAAVALWQRWDGGLLVWDAIIPFTIASVMGVLVGTRMAGRYHGYSLVRAFVVLMLAVAAYVALRAALAIPPTSRRIRDPPTPPRRARPRRPAAAGRLLLRRRLVVRHHRRHGRRVHRHRPGGCGARLGR
jgi:uncharacterized membrane protein YfcA